MITWGINALNHDASIAVVNDGELRFWKRSSEYTGVAGDQYLCSRIYHDALTASNGHGPDEIVWYEHPLWKIKEASVVVLDAIGEWESISIWKAQDMKLTRVFSRSYPTSLGIFYSAFTDLIGLKPLGEEHVLQKLSEQGDPSRYRELVKKYWRDDLTLRYNLHRGVWNWSDLNMDDQGKKDLAAAVQEEFELQAQKVFNWAKKLAPSDNLVYMGGCAMNSKFNNHLSDQYKKIWSLPIPGDASSAIGAALYKQQKRIKLPFSPVKHIGIK